MTSLQTASTGSARRRTIPETKREIGRPELRARMEQLIARYPEVSEEETREILAFLRKGPHLDVGLVTSEDALRPKIEEIRARHRDEFRLKAHQVVLFIAVIYSPFFYLAAKYLL